MWLVKMLVNIALSNPLCNDAKDDVSAR